jgi:hypothetical protein
LITAQQNPVELAMYLLRRNFSLQSQVTEKSIAMPLNPTAPNLKNRASIIVLIQAV